ncbi:MAG: GIY-YIG nuclease family protein [Selenomonadaceae bacterium]|nr:GIY-YIG nuclease family protein [Selenomonadaceae bacterium]MBR1805905.1 GIY-YIG nuclease family protein [Selenomonadaceae bacterium]
MKLTHVYVFGADDCPRIKIGISDAPKRRETELINGCGFENAHMLWVSPPMTKKEAMLHESALHRRLAEYNTSGEWFRADKVTVDNITQYFAEQPTKPPIKFRGIRCKMRDKGQPVYGGYSQRGNNYVLIWHSDGQAGAEVFPTSVRQLVGFDRSGCEIYEDDILVDNNGKKFTARLVSAVVNDEGFLCNIPLEQLKLKEEC